MTDISLTLERIYDSIASKEMKLVEISCKNKEQEEKMKDLEIELLKYQ